MVIRDISERKQAEQQLQDSLERYHYVNKATHDAIWDWNLVEDIVFWGDGFETLFGYDLDNLSNISSSWVDHIQPDDKDRVYKSIRKAIEGKEQHWFEEYRYLHADGEYRIVEDQGYIIRNDEGVAVRMIGAMRDVTEHNQLEEKLQDAYEMARIGVWEVDLQNNKLHWSSMTKELHEVSPDFEPDLETAINFYAPGESRDLIQKCVKKGIEEGVPWDEELQIVTAKGQKKWVRAKGTPELVDGTCQRVYGIFQDIHERKQAQLKRIEALQEQERILERITEGFFAVDENWTVTYWNKMAEKIIGTTRSQILNQNLWDKFPEARELKFFQEYERAFKEQISVSFEEYYPPLDIWLELNAYPSEDGLSIFFRDITTRKIHEQKLEDSLKEKETLLMEIHHRVKNNLAVVSGLMQLQAFSSEDEVLREKLDDSVNRIKTMASIHELLYKSRVKTT
jgi:PAS domain S-box-containing protein